MDLRNTKIAVGQTAFVLDTERRELRQWNDPGNGFYLDDLPRDENGWRMVFDTRTENFTSEAPTPCGRAFPVLIPDWLLDFSRHPRQHTIDEFNDEARRMEWNLSLVSEALNVRLMGVLPTMAIDGDLFTVDWAFRELRYTGSPLHAIPFDAMESLDGTGYQFFYDRKCSDLFEFSSDVTELPDDVVLVRTPDARTLDSVALAQQSGEPELALQLEYPYRQHHVAAITPLSKTRLPILIAENLERQKEQEKADPLVGRSVMVSPHHSPDIHGLKGEVVEIARFDRSSRMAYIDFGQNTQLAFRASSLLVFKPVDRLLADMHPDKGLSEDGFMKLIEIARYLSRRTPEAESRAYDVLLRHDYLAPFATVTLNDALNRSTGRDEHASPFPMRGR